MYKKNLRGPLSIRHPPPSTLHQPPFFIVQVKYRAQVNNKTVEPRLPRGDKGMFSLNLPAGLERELISVETDRTIYRGNGK